jgi:hypothetical protein
MVCTSVNFIFCDLDDWGLFVSFLFGTMSMSWAHHGLQAHYLEVLPISRMQGVLSSTPSLCLSELGQADREYCLYFCLAPNGSKRAGRSWHTARS